MALETGSRVLETLVEEYKVQRTAAGDKVKTSQHTITFGGATAGILVAAGFNIWNRPVPATMIFLVAIPLICTAVVVQWVGQMLSSARTHEYLNTLEDAILAELSRAETVPDALFSKHAPRSKKWPYVTKRWFAENAAVFVFVLLAFGSLLLGVYKGWSDYRTVVVVVGVVELVALLSIAILLLRAIPRPQRNAPTASEDRTYGVERT